MNKIFNNKGFNQGYFFKITALACTQRGYLQSTQVVRRTLI